MVIAADDLTTHPLSFTILYADGDLCIIRTNDNRTMIYSRNASFNCYKSASKRAAISCLSLPLWVGRFFGVGRKGASAGSGSGSGGVSKGGKIRITADTFSALQLGEVTVDEGGNDDDYDDSDDPLGYMTADERQAYIAELKLSDVGRIEREIEINEKNRREREVIERGEREKMEKARRGTFKGPE